MVLELPRAAAAPATATPAPHVPHEAAAVEGVSADEKVVK
jgi:hypothetical protein